jgi:23S rRNA (pseudouridine1915-N3)-methyltransferase
MSIHVICVGQKMPAWVLSGFGEYAKRMPREWRIQLHEIPLEKRTKTSAIDQLKQREGEHILKAIPKNAHVIALEVKGKPWSTETLATQCADWQQLGKPITLLIGGPDGLSDACRERADQLWSLSPLTLPHPLVRVILAEQLYRAVSILSNHPYHR